MGKVGFTLKERAFISALLSHGFNKKQAYLSVCPDVDEHSADVLGSRIYQRIIKKKTAGNHCLTLLVLMISGLVMKLTNGLKLKRRNFTRAKRLPLLLTMALACAVPSFSQKSEVGENQKSIYTITKKKPSQRYSKGNRKKMTLTLRPKQSKAFKSMGTEILYGGAAGGGKSHLYRVASITWCNDIPGLQVYIFRRTHPELMDEHMTGPTSFRVMLSPWVRSGKVRIVDDSKIYFRPRKVRFPDTGEEKELISTIHLCHCQYLKNVYDYQSAEMHVLMPGEAGNWPNQMYTYLRGRVRLSGIVIPQRYEGLFPRIVLTANPGGIGHHWLKMGWVDKGPGLHQMPDSEGGMIREYIPALLDDNPDLLKYDPNYERRLQGLGNSALVRALRYGDWDIVAGGALDDVWDRTVHVIKPFKIPASWYVDRSFDWGSSKPFSVGWWAESDGTEIADPPSGVKKSYPRGTIFRVGEWYGWNGKPNEGTKTEDVDIGKGIAAKEKNLREYLGIRQRIQPGPADSSIFEADPGKLSIAQGIDSGYGQRGCFVPADKSPGSRKNGLSVLRRKLKASLAERLEEPGFFVFNTCNDGFIRTVPVLPRSERDMDDVDTQAEDHAYDETRYRIAAAKRIASRVSITFGGA